MLDKHFLTGFSKIQGHFLFVQNEKKIWFIKVFSWLKYLKWIIKSQLFQYFQLKATGRRTRKIFIVRSIKQSIANIKTQSPRGALWKLLQISQENTFIGAFFQKCWRPRSATLLKKRFRHKCFSTNFVKKKFKSIFFYWTPPVAASVQQTYLFQANKNAPAEQNILLLWQRFAKLCKAVWAVSHAKDGPISFQIFMKRAKQNHELKWNS